MAEDGKKTGPETAPQPSVEELAKRLMDLWQEQMAAIAADPDLMRQMAQMMAASPFPAMMQGIMQGVLAASAKTGPQNPYEWWKAENGAGAKPPAAAPSPEVGTPAAAPASQPGGGDLAELRRNLAGLEARLAELGGGGTGEPASQPKPKRPRKPQKPVAGAAGGSGESGAGGAGGGAAG
ncbi:hypothetical protein [Dongia sp.]|uniref:hypothetical protein n=1 Tax=Dongia sp. TaxID=1977262 RepID=UPI0037519ED0